MPIRGHKTGTAAVAAAIATATAGSKPSTSNSSAPAPISNGFSDTSSSRSQKQNAKANITKSMEYKNQGNECVKKGDFRKAAAFYTEAIRLNKFDPVFLTNRALCYLKLQKYHECIEDCTIAIQLDSKSVKAYYRRMLAYEQLKINLNEALSDCQTALEIEPKNTDALRSLDRIQQLINSKEKTIEFKTDTNLNKSEFTIKETASTKLKKSEKATITVPWPKDLSENQKFKKTEFIHKAPHLRSKEPLKSIKIDEVFAFSDVETKLAANTESPQATVTEEAEASATSGRKENVLESQINDPDHNGNFEAIPVVPDKFLKPKTTTQFYRAWNTYQNRAQRSKIIEVSPNVFSTLPLNVNDLFSFSAIIPEHLQ